jgi:transcriptional regulator with XRE-family HTH domain
MPPERKSTPRSPDHGTLGRAIEQLRERRGLTQEQLADIADVHPTHLGGIERGVGNPSYSTLLKLVGALETRIGALVALAEKLRDKPTK